MRMCRSGRLVTTLTLLALLLAPSSAARAQSDGPAIFVANNGNCEGSVTSFTVNTDGTLNFVEKVVTGSVPCGSGQTAPGLNAQTIAISPNGRWLITGHGTISGTIEQLTFYEVFPDASVDILFTTTTPDSPVDVGWIDDDYVAVTATPSGNDFIIIYAFNSTERSLVQHYYQPVASIFDFVIDRPRNLIFVRDGTSGVSVFHINKDRTITDLSIDPVPTGVFFLGPNISPDGTRLYYGGGISTYNGLSSRWIGGMSVDAETGSLTPLPNMPYLSPPSDGTSGPSPKEVDVSSDGQFAFVNHGGTGHIKGFAIAKDGVLSPIENSYFDVGGQGDSGNMSIMGDWLFVPRRYSGNLGPSGALSLTIQQDGTLVQNGGTFPTLGSLPWDIATWPGTIEPCAADITGDLAVNVDDLLAVINNWGSTGGPADVTADGAVNVDDLLAVINSWGTCG